MLSFGDIDRVLDDALADYGAPDDIKNLVRCNRFYRAAMILELLQTAAEMRKNPELLRQDLTQATAEAELVDYFLTPLCEIKEE